MAAEAQGAVDHDRAGPGESGGQHVQAALEHDGNMESVAAHCAARAPFWGSGEEGTHLRVPTRSEGEAAYWRRGSDVRRPEREEAEGYVRTALTRNSGVRGERHASHFAPL
ncbi:hypothetical protein TPA0910_34800 [Streptomyces hygroscopicus subsp. sporocinereus]|uniref:Uncharacterized protein n=1 Tax=Streptomyces hygroscopicus TaxID=1912 RepID=A0ABQ3U090_STRHY|nr:hypothetical protein TPA0910_34800 [Streptomyces hygroscopicus]